MVAGVALGPLRLAVRAVLRRAGGRRTLGRQAGVTRGLAAGLVAAPVLAGAAQGGSAAIHVAAIGLAVLLAAMDLAWRWLPHEWTWPLLGLGLVAAAAGAAPSATALGGVAGAALGGGLLAFVQLGFRHVRGIEALGTGDVWLAAAIGAFTGPGPIPWVIALAAVTALGAEMLGARLFPAPRRSRLGVAYGTHLAVMFPIFLL